MMKETRRAIIDTINGTVQHGELHVIVRSKRDILLNCIIQLCNINPPL